MKNSVNLPPLRGIPLKPQSLQVTEIPVMVRNNLLAPTCPSRVEQSVTQVWPHILIMTPVFCSRKSGYVPSYLHCSKWAHVNLSNHSSEVHHKQMAEMILLRLQWLECTNQFVIHLQHIFENYLYYFRSLAAPREPCGSKLYQLWWFLPGWWIWVWLISLDHWLPSMISQRSALFYHKALR